MRVRLGALRRDRSYFFAFGSVSVAALCLAIAVSAVALQRWDRFETNAFDLGFFDQIIYNTLHLRPGQTTFIPYNFNGQHIEPVLFVFLIPYVLGAGPPFLMLTQAIVASAA